MRVFKTLNFFGGCCWLALLFLSACSSSHHQYVESQERRSCIAHCEVLMKQCQGHCQDHCKQCEAEAVGQTQKDYKRYLKERCVQGKSFIRRLQSYHDPLECRKTTCDCPADFRVCVESCRGSIHKQIQVEKSCC
jgi:hypothetical protein